ncbi:MAG: protein SCO1/2 [Gammaproteobacteria bacterium]|jgi:protein SCO1/2
MNKSRITINLLIVLAAGLALLWTLNTTKPIELTAGTWFGDQARTVPAFALTDQFGQPFGNANFTGKWNLIFFGYAHCPDICPTTLHTLAAMLGKLDDPKLAAKIQIIFVSVDPNRDTNEAMANYVNNFDSRFIAATTAIESLTPFTRFFGISHQSAAKDDDRSAYLVEHSGAILLVNPQAEYAGVFSAPHDAAALARDMQHLIDNYR